MMTIKMTRGADEIQSCVDRILQGGTFRNAPSSRRLLKYLVDHSLAGDADQLKEYTIGVDSFNKPGDYDPRLDSTVRIQIGRLRQKLAEYYREEGKDDQLIVDLPKGRFSLICEPRSAAAAASAEEDPEPAPSPSPWRLAALALAGLCLMMSAVAIYSYAKLRTAQNASAALWSSDLSELWRPFLNTGRPLIIAVGNPLFLQFENKALYRDLSIEKPDDLLKLPQFGALSKALGSRNIVLVKLLVERQGRACLGAAALHERGVDDDAREPR